MPENATTATYSDWTLAQLNAAIESDERIFVKEGARTFVVDQREHAAMRNERVARLFGCRNTR